jgi:hypothetical protein
MNDEKRDRKQVRSKDGEAVPENTQSLGDPDLSSHQELKSILWHWSAPCAPTRLDARVMASYRQHGRRGSWWRRPMFFWPTSLPARLAVVASLCLLAFVIVQRVNHRSPETGLPLESSVIDGNDVEFSEHEARYVTYIHGSGFQPVRPVRIQIIRGSHQNEN